MHQWPSSRRACKRARRCATPPLSGGCSEEGCGWGGGRRRGSAGRPRRCDRAIVDVGGTTCPLCPHDPGCRGGAACLGCPSAAVCYAPVRRFARRARVTLASLCPRAARRKVCSVVAEAARVMRSSICQGARATCEKLNPETEPPLAPSSPHCLQLLATCVSVHASRRARHKSNYALVPFTVGSALLCHSIAASCGALTPQTLARCCSPRPRRGSSRLL